jgi:hypothetical protein
MQLVMIMPTNINIMKANLLLLLIAALSFSNLHAQSIHLGIKGGANVNKLTGQSFTDKFSFGYHIGGFIEIGIGKKLSLQPEVFVSQIKQDTSSQFRAIYNNLLGVAPSNIQLSYLNLPILLGYKLSDQFSIQLGPQYSILMNQNANLLQNGKNAFKNGDFSILGGLQLEVSKFRIYGRYVVGLNNLNDIDKMDEWKNQSLQIGIGLTIL